MLLNTVYMCNEVLWNQDIILVCSESSPAASVVRKWLSQSKHTEPLLNHHMSDLHVKYLRPSAQRDDKAFYVSFNGSPL